jgi:hypothetical protein
VIAFHRYGEANRASRASRIATKLGAAGIAFLVGITSGISTVNAQSDNEYLLAAQSQADWNPRRAQIQQVQSWLKKLGYNPGPTNGALTEDMRLALRLYQRDNDLAENGRLTRKVYDHLKASASKLPEPQEQEEAATEPSDSQAGAAAQPTAQAETPQPQDSETIVAGVTTATQVDPLFPQQPIEAPTSDPNTARTSTNPEPAPEIATSLFPEDEAADPVTTPPETSSAAPSVLALESPPQPTLEPQAPPGGETTALQPGEPTLTGRVTTIDESGVRSAQPETQTAMIPPRPGWCPSAANGSWAIVDETGSQFIITLKEDGTVSGPLYPEYWTWRPTDLGIEIHYNNGMGQRVTRHGAVRPGATLAGEASDSRGRTWSWTAVRTPDSPQSSCEAKGPA